MLNSASLGVTAALALTGLGNASEPPNTTAKPHWVKVPSVELLDSAYPAKALRANVSGSVTLLCTVGKDGWMEECTVTAESPPQMGFAAAARSLVKYFRTAGIPEGAKLTIPLSWRAPL